MAEPPLALIHINEEYLRHRLCMPQQYQIACDSSQRIFSPVSLLASAHLAWRQPQGPLAGIMLGEDGKHALHGAQDGSVQDHRLLQRLVLRPILQIEPAPRERSSRDSTIACGLRIPVSLHSVKVTAPTLGAEGERRRHSNQQQPAAAVAAMEQQEKFNRGAHLMGSWKSSCMVAHWNFRLSASNTVMSILGP